ncbi:MAG TPA: CheR family methyltransferase [Candidatus Angelobacter sp.]|nr:CheR family methyltransferase [Candidatus Angelobacter sp.]
MTEQATLAELIQELAEERDIDLRGYKHTTLERRIQRRMQQLSTGSYHEYLEYVRSHPGETSELLNTVLINVTRFFRDIHAWDTLQHEVLPVLFHNRSLGTPFRVWCAGCATGEEAYSSAILLCEFLGPRIKDYEIKIYATDHDDEALTIARRAEYNPDHLRGMRPEIREKYFTGETTLRVARDVRRMVIFGRSNLLTDAPISHVDLLVCRNVLIYFDSTAQEHILRQLHYALNEGGVLFLGKAESQLKRNSDFVPISPRWRIFQRRSSKTPIDWPKIGGRMNMESESNEKAQQELQALKLYYDTILGTLESGVLVIDPGDIVISGNERLLKLWDFSNKMEGQKLQNTELWQRCPELKQHLEESRKDQPHAVNFECYANPVTMVSVTIKPILTESAAAPLGTLIYMENVTPRLAMQSTVEELETTAEELQSTNEELETTNEELQSTNEELETTNEELQSTNEELETTNEELQSLNEELETTNEELSSRTRELDEVNARYSEMMERMPWPVFLVDQEGLIYMFNSASKKLFGFAEPSERGMKLEELPMDSRSRQAMLRRHQSAVQTKRQTSVRSLHLVTNRFDGKTDVHFTPLARDSGRQGMIVMFEIQPGKTKADTKNSKAASAKRRKKTAGAKKKKKSGR